MQALEIGGRMSSKIYKYMGVDVFKLALEDPSICSLKCSYPKDFNDPYELFLTINFEQSPEMLATYNEAIGDLPQLPTTCFSKSPGVIPMWAHYGHGHTGIVLEFDEERFSERFPNIGFGDIDYKDSPSDDLLDMLSRACYIGKPRYYYLLQRGVFSAAYYTKHSHWSYEQERRLVASDDDVEINGNLMLLKSPSDCISAIIVGGKADEDAKGSAKELADHIGANYLELKISRISPNPYFVDTDGVRYKHDEDGFESYDFVCDKCGEPLREDNDLCSFCAIEDYHIENAFVNNPLRMIAELGNIEEYYRSMNSVGKRNRPK